MSILLLKEVCPYGPLGNTLIKPMLWRVLNDNKRFVNDWHMFIKQWRSWKRSHPLTKLDNWLWERNKNQMREWWFSLSKYEQRQLFGIRKDTGQKVINHFTGPRYQRGTIFIGASGASGATIAEPSAVLSLDSANNSVLNVDFSPVTLHAGFQVQRNGDLQRCQGANSHSWLDINASTDWVRPATSTIGDSYEVKWNAITNGGQINQENFTEDIWTQITTDMRVEQQYSSASSPSTFEFDIGDNGASTSDVNQDYIIEAGEII